MSAPSDDLILSRIPSAGQYFHTNRCTSIQTANFESVKVLRRRGYRRPSVCCSRTPSVTIPKNGKEMFNAAFRKYQHTHTHCCYTADGFLCVKMMYNTVFVKCL